MFQNHHDAAPGDDVPLVELHLSTFKGQGKDSHSNPKQMGSSITSRSTPFSPFIGETADLGYEQYSSRYDSRSHLSGGESDEEGIFISESGQKPCKKSMFRWPTGWKFGTALAASLTFLILIGNLTVLGIFVSKIRSSVVGGDIAAIKTGGCDDIKRLNFGIHLAINILSTLLLGASNYCMQTISAPTRYDVDKAHAKGRWLQIGIPSFQNLRFIDKRRLLVWICLAASSIPLHLVYNSIFFMSTTNNNYRVYYADESFTTGAAFNQTHFSYSDSYGNGYADDEPKTIQREIMSDNHLFQNLTKDECIKAYANNMIQDRGAVVLIVERPQNCSVYNTWTIDPQEPACSDPSTTSLYKGETYSFTPLANYGYWNNYYYWICSQKGLYPMKSSPDPNGLSPEELPPLCSNGHWRTYLGDNSWEVGQGNTKVKYCLSKKVQSRCELQVATNLIGVVVAFNIVKLIVIVIMATSNWINFEPLVTVGDAVASFIERPDPTTKGMCLLSAKDILGMRKGAKNTTIYQVFQAHRKNRSSAVTSWRWMTTSILTVITVSAIFGLFGFAVNDLKSYDKSDFQSLWSFGLGSITPYTLINGWSLPYTGEAGTVSTVLIANLPQVLLSFLYMLLNGVITAMATASEWSNFAQHAPKPLRVSFPEGSQRSTFFLQLPYRYSLPLMVVSVLIHWLISQSIFIAKVIMIRTWKPEGQQVDQRPGRESTIITAGYSPLAMVLTALVILLVFFTTVVLGRFKLHSCMPVAGNCSGAISAACHCPLGTSSCEPMKWGVVTRPEFSSNRVGHCSFTNGQAELPEPGSRYAGYPDTTNHLDSPLKEAPTLS